MCEGYYLAADYNYASGGTTGVLSFAVPVNKFITIMFILLKNEHKKERYWVQRLPGRVVILYKFYGSLQ